MANSPDDSQTELEPPPVNPIVTGPASGWGSLADFRPEMPLPPLPGPDPQSADPPPASAPVDDDAELLHELQRPMPSAQTEAPESIFSDEPGDDEDVLGLGERKTVELPLGLSPPGQPKSFTPPGLGDSPAIPPGLFPTLAAPMAFPNPPMSPAAPSELPSVPATMPVAAAWPLAEQGTEMSAAVPAPAMPAPSAPTVANSVELSPPPVASPTSVNAAPEAVSSSRGWLTLLVLLYAVVATVAALAGWFRALPGDHPLSIIPDTFGEYDPAQRKKVSLRIDPDAELPPQLRVALGQSIRIGDLEVAPLSIAEQKVVRVTEYLGYTKPVRQPFPKPLLVMHVLVTNRSPDVSFCPVDPAFNRKAVWGEPCVTGLYFADDSRVLGGPIAWPFGEGIRRVYLEGQEADEQPLEPGQSREVLICAAADPDLVLTVRESINPILWKLHLRRGRILYGLRDLAVTTLLGVEFRAEQVQWLDGGKPIAS